MKILWSFGFFFTVSWTSLAMQETCKWVMDVLEMVTDTHDVTVFRPYQSEIQVGEPYFIRLRISCKKQVRRTVIDTKY